MEEAYVSSSVRMRGDPREHIESEEISGKSRKRVECYKQCMEDPWDLKDETTCASVCGV
ncbi:MAG TPA: hypothetical protein VMC85_18655 [Desulfomonilaceae bacterium]|nr:hypothetical protein [Desulfomonilaceae bacterium]